MKRIVFLILCGIPWAVSAQGVLDSVPAHRDVGEHVVSISSSDYRRLVDSRDSAMARIRALEQERDSLSRRCAVNDSVVRRLATANDDLTWRCAALSDKEERLSKQCRKADAYLFNISVNFLFIAYEAYSIDSIAVPAFDAIHDSKLKAEHRAEEALLKNYQGDIRAFLAYLNSVEEELNKPFSKGNAFGSGFVERLHKEKFYLNYAAYKHWKGTYLGRRILKLEESLKDFDNGRVRQVCASVRSELEACLKTLEDL